MSVALESHYGVKVSRLIVRGLASRAVHARITKEINHLRPLMMYMKGARSGYYVVIDGYRWKHRRFFVHLNVGNSGFDNEWYELGLPICLKHFSNGERSQHGTCAHYYDYLTKFEIWSISVVKRP